MESTYQLLPDDEVPLVLLMRHLSVVFELANQGRGWLHLYRNQTVPADLGLFLGFFNVVDVSVVLCVVLGVELLDSSRRVLEVGAVRPEQADCAHH
jgi:hypothetical protein